MAGFYGRRGKALKCLGKKRLEDCAEASKWSSGWIMGQGLDSNLLLCGKAGHGGWGFGQPHLVESVCVDGVGILQVPSTPNYSVVRNLRDHF